MSEIRLICLDMDGTLLDDDHATVPPRNIAALRAAAEQGASVAIASGRAWALLQGVHAQIGVTRYAVLSNGAAVLDVKAGKWIYRRAMDQKARRMKQLSDHLFEYALVTSETQAPLDPSISFQAAFFDVFSETAAFLQQQGFSVSGGEVLRMRMRGMPFLRDSPAEAAYQDAVLRCQALPMLQKGSETPKGCMAEGPGGLPFLL